jgi:endonuclease/exonuclease/phosphatase family metal-dependent hydrolase
MRLRHASTLLPALLALAVAGCQPEEADRTKVTVMTRNLYLGTDLTPIFDPTQPAETLPLRVEEAWANVVATDFATRAMLLAGEIAAVDPDLVGLQEVSLWYSGPCADPPYCTALATTVEYDFLALLLAALDDLGASYEAAASVDNFGAQLPSTGDGVSWTARRYQDRDVILRRTGFATSNPQGGNFSIGLPITVAGQDVVVTRGWVSVDVERDGVMFRFANAHLEAYNLPEGNGLGPDGSDLPPDSIRAGQAVELIDLVTGPFPVILVGDMNSDPADPTERAYQALVIGAGYFDVWQQMALAGAGPGLSCCYDALVSDPDAALYNRIDLVLVRAPFELEAAAVLGTTFDEASGFWPSDHAGVFATVAIEEL